MSERDGVRRTGDASGRDERSGAAPRGWLAGLRSTSGPVRFRQYTRYSMHSFAVIEALLMLSWLLGSRAGTDGVTAAVLMVPFAAHTVGVGVLSHQGLQSYLGEREQPRRAVAVFLAVTAVAVVLPPVLLGAGVAGPDVLVPLAWVLVFAAGPPMLALPLRRGAAWAASAVVVGVVLTALAGAPLRGLLALAASGVLGGGFMGFAYRFSGWSLRVVNELVAARETQARLAVAEERLRFARDMHDVLGRNLSVIALKSELAAELARRGADAAVAQMTEVQQIARESQRELREVVRGYRQADFHTELVGARGVLRAAGIDCRVEDAGSGQLTEAAHAALGWVVREGVTNVLRHAQAAHCRIRLRQAPAPEGEPEGTVAVLVMENDGVPPRPSGGGTGSGLAGLRERLAALGGSVTAEELPGGRFRLTARVPQPPDAGQADGPAQRPRAAGEAADGRTTGRRGGRGDGGGDGTTVRRRTSGGSR